LVAAFAVKNIYFPPVNDSIFRLDYRGLQRAPKNVLILRQTHFASSLRRGSVVASYDFKDGKQIMRMMGRKVSLAQVIETAYSCSSSRVILPPDSPKENYDFLVTVPDKPNEHFQAAIKNKLGYVVNWEPRETKVLSLIIKTTNAPGLQPSTNGENSSVSFRNGKLECTHMRLGFLTGYLENTLKQPVLDQTHTTDYYDFSMAWDWNKFRDGMDQTMVDKALNSLGLELDPEAASMQMLVVKKTD
jgi:uncharacterized protein (TIGR03435 family)